MSLIRDTSVDFQHLPVKSFVAETQAGTPLGPVEGQIVYDSLAHRVKVYENGVWVAASQTGAELQTNKNIANGYAGLDGNTKIVIGQIPTGLTSSTVLLGNTPLSSIVAPIAPVGMNSQRLINLGAPSGSTDGARLLDIQQSQFAYLPTYQNLLGWTFDPQLVSGGSIVVGSGTEYVCRLYTPVDITVSSIWAYVVTPGASLTHVGFALFNYDGTRNKTAIDTGGATTTAFQTSGLKQISIASNTISAGFFYVCFFFVGTTLPTLARAHNTDATLVNVGLTSSLRYSTANTGLSTSFPSPMATQVAAPNAWWLAVS